MVLGWSRSVDTAAKHCITLANIQNKGTDKVAQLSQNYLKFNEQRSDI